MGPRDQATAEALHQSLERTETAETAHAREIEAKPDTAYSHDLRQATIRAVITTRTRAALAAIIRHCDNLAPTPAPTPTV